MKTMRMRTCVFAALLFLLALCACGKKSADISEYADAEITVSGLTDEDFTVTPSELSELDCVRRTAAGATAKAGTVDAYGPLLNTFLAQYGCASADFKKIRFLASDGYKVVLKGEYLTDYEIVLAISCGAEPLPEEQRPLRLLIPEAESGMWAYAVDRIEFVKEE